MLDHVIAPFNHVTTNRSRDCKLQDRRMFVACTTHSYDHVMERRPTSWARDWAWRDVTITWSNVPVWLWVYLQVHLSQPSWALGTPLFSSPNFGNFNRLLTFTIRFNIFHVLIIILVYFLSLIKVISSTLWWSSLRDQPISCCMLVTEIPLTDLMNWFLRSSPNPGNAWVLSPRMISLSLGNISPFPRKITPYPAKISSFITKITPSPGKITPFPKKSPYPPGRSFLIGNLSVIDRSVEW